MQKVSLTGDDSIFTVVLGEDLENKFIQGVERK